MASIRYYLVLGSTNFCEEFYESELRGREIRRIEGQSSAKNGGTQIPPTTGELFLIYSDLGHQTQRFADLEQFRLLDAFQFVLVELQLFIQA